MPRSRRVQTHSMSNVLPINRALPYNSIYDLPPGRRAVCVFVCVSPVFFLFIDKQNAIIFMMREFLFKSAIEH